MKIFTTAIFSLLTLSAAPAFASDINMHEGMWEMTTTMQVEGMPQGMGGGMPPSVSRECLTQKDIVSPDKEENCEVVKQDISGNTISWKIQCNNDGEISDMDGHHTYNGDTMEGIMHMNEHGMKATAHTTGKRVGPCS